MERPEIKKILPQRYPFLFIDDILEFEKDKKLVALKNATANEEFFAGHFPDRPVMPGVLLIEAMGQAGIVFLSMNNTSLRGDEVAEAIPNEEIASSAPSALPRNDGVYFLCAVKARFRKPVVPGDRVIIEITPVKVTSDAGIVKAVATVNGEEVARAELTGTKRRQ